MMGTLAQRFEAKVDRSVGQGPRGDCHLWTAGTSPRGYGRIKAGDGAVFAHRVAWFLHAGVWPHMNVLHHCDTPACVRFDHLFLGTQPDNMADMAAKGRSTRGDRNPQAKLTPVQLQEILSLRGVLLQREIAAMFGITQPAVSMILAGRRWSTW